MLRDYIIYIIATVIAVYIDGVFAILTVMALLGVL